MSLRSVVLCAVLSGCGHRNPAPVPVRADEPRCSAATEPSPIANGHQLLQWQHSDTVRKLVPLAGDLVATSGDDGTVRVWSAGARTLLQVLPGRRLIGSMAGGTSVVVAALPPDPVPYLHESMHEAVTVSGDGPPLAPVPYNVARLRGTGTARWLTSKPGDETSWHLLDDKLEPAGTIPRGSEQRLDQLLVTWWSQGESIVGQSFAARSSTLEIWRRGASWKRFALRTGNTSADIQLLAGVDPAGKHAVLFTPELAELAGDVRILDLEATAASATAPMFREEDAGVLLDKVPTLSLWPQVGTAFSTDGSRLAIASGAALSVYDLATRKLVWRADAMQRMIGAANPRWNDVVAFQDANPHGFTYVEFTADNNHVIAQSTVGSYVYDAKRGRFQGELGARSRAPVAAPRFGTNGELLVETAGHLQRWDRNGRLFASEDVPPYFHKPECSSSNPYAMTCARVYGDAWWPLPNDETLRMRVAIDQPFGYSADLTWRDACGAGADRVPIVVEHLRGLLPLEPVTSTKLPAFKQLPPVGQRTLMCSPVYPGVTALARRIDLEHGRIVGLVFRRADWGNGLRGSAIYDFRSQAVTPLQGGDAYDTRWENGLVAGKLRAESPMFKLALWNDRGALLWQSGELAGDDDVVAVSPDGKRAIYQVQLGSQPRVALTVALPSGAELARRELAEPCASGGERTAWWKPGTDEVICGTAAGELVVIAGARAGTTVKSSASAIRAITASADGTRLAIWSADGLVTLRDTVHLRLLASQAELHDGEWLTFTPGGAYQGSAEAADRVSWVFEDDGERAVFRFEQFATGFHRPDLVQRRLAGEDVDAAGLHRPPTVKVTSSLLPDGRVRLHVDAKSPGRVDVVRVFVEGRMRAARTLCQPAGALDLEVPLAAGPNKISVVAFDSDGLASNPVQLDFVGRGDERPELWILAVGVGRYPRLPASAQLPAPANDVRSIVAAFEAQTGPNKTYARLHAITLIDDQVTGAAIEKALVGLSKMRPGDVAVVFMAGHGAKPGSDEDMVFLTPTTTGTRPAELRAGGVGWKQLGRRLAALPGRVLVLLDACHAGHLTQDLVVPNEATARSLATGGRAGIVVFAASKGRQLSFEPTGTRSLARIGPDPALDKVLANNQTNGLFTAAVVASLASGEGDRDGNGALELSELLDDVALRVARASGGLQTPWVARRELFGDYRIGASNMRARPR